MDEGAQFMRILIADKLAEFVIHSLEDLGFAVLWTVA